MIREFFVKGIRAIFLFAVRYVFAYFQAFGFFVLGSMVFVIYTFILVDQGFDFPQERFFHTSYYNDGQIGSVKFSSDFMLLIMQLQAVLALLLVYLENILGFFKSKTAGELSPGKLYKASALVDLVLFSGLLVFICIAVLSGRSGLFVYVLFSPFLLFGALLFQALGIFWPVFIEWLFFKGGMKAFRSAFSRRHSTKECR